MSSLNKMTRLNWRVIANHLRVTQAAAERRIMSIKITAIEMTDDYLSSVMETALGAGHTHGIGYWADVDSAVEYDAEIRIVSMIVIDRDSEKRFTLHRDAIKNGVLCALQRGNAGVLSTDDLDGPTVDIIVQCACFNDVLYG